MMSKNWFEDGDEDVKNPGTTFLTILVVIIILYGFMVL